MAQFHEERFKMGIITRWTFLQRITTTLNNGFLYFANINEFKSLCRLQLDQVSYSDKLPKKILNMSLLKVWKKMASLRKIDQAV
jgi:hypothetical protein